MKTTPSGYQRGLVQRAATALALLWALTLSFTSADAAERNLVRRATPIPTPAVGQRIGRVIVSLKPESALFRRQALSASHSAAVVGDEAQRRANALSSSAGVALTAGRFLGERAQVVMAQGVDSVTLAARLARHADVEYAVPDARRRAHLVPNDPLFSAGPASGVGPEVGQWYLRAPDDTIRSAVTMLAVA